MVITATPISAPVTLLRPPTISITRVSSVKSKKNELGATVPSCHVRSDAATATIVTDSSSATSCGQNGLMPIARAARSSSRAACASRPVREAPNTTATTTAITRVR